MTNHEHAEINHQHTDNGSKGLKVALIVVVVMMVAEIIGGILSNSLALLSDAGHMLVDALALGLSLIAMNLARRPATTKHTYGLHRAEIMAALANGVTLVLIAAFIFYEAYQRFRNPPTVHTPIMLGVAVLGLVANLIAMRLLHHARHSNLNVRAAFWHVLGDTISSVGVIVGGVIIAITGWKTVDPIIAIVIGIIILWGAVNLVRESVDILLETTPKHIQMDKVTEAIKKVPGVEELHDVHIWTITSGIYALSTHILIDDCLLSHTSEIIAGINRELAQKFNITHTTFQLESEKCATCAEGLVCQIKRSGEVENH
ncbi:MAG: cation diffusion facilitator family transporter [Dehalococcoidales bacterium]|nr:cation diffusion facilitator family transporter [Dehalococcoidales bacterium]